MKPNPLIPLVVACILILLAGSAHADDLVATVRVEGFVEAIFRGLQIDGEVEGIFRLDGTVAEGSKQEDFSAEGVIEGMGTRDILSLTTEGWVMLSGSGRMQTGAPVTLAFLLYTLRQSIIPLRAGEAIEGTLHCVLQVGQRVNVFHGTFQGSLSGRLTPEQTGPGLRLEGGGAVLMLGTRSAAAARCALPATVPLDREALSPHFLKRIQQQFDCPLDPAESL